MHTVLHSLTYYFDLMETNLFQQGNDLVGVELEHLQVMERPQEPALPIAELGQIIVLEDQAATRLQNPADLQQPFLLVAPLVKRRLAENEIDRI
jgi:hypothetical protein